MACGTRNTLDAGHVQIEGSLINYYKFSKNVSVSGVYSHISEEEYLWPPRIRVGLLNNVDFDISPSFEIRSETVNRTFSAPFTPGTFSMHESRDTFGSIDLGPTINLWGNDSGTTAFALHPFVSIPTDRGDILSGLELPFELNLAYGFYLKLDSSFGLTDDTSHTHYGEFNNDVSIHKPLCKEAEAYWYLNSEVTAAPGTPWHGYTGFGLIYKATANFQLFGGIGFGLNSESFDYNPRFGLIYRL